MVVPYWSMPRNRFGRLLWIALTAVIALTLAALGIVTLVQAPRGQGEGAGASDIVWQWLVVLLCGLGAAAFGWLLADGFRAAKRERAERRRIAEQLADAEARIRHLRNPGR